MKQKLDNKNIFESSLIVIVSILVYQIMKGFHTYFFLVDDNYTQFAPIIQEAFSEFFHTGKMPIYDFYQMKGTIIADQGYYALANGCMLIAYLLTKLFSAWNVVEIYIMLCVCFGNIGMNFLLKRLHFQTTIRMLLLFSYTTCTAFFYFGYWYYIYGNYLLMPCLLFAVIKIFDSKQKKSDYVCAGIVLFFSCCLGNIQYTFYHYLLFAVFSVLLIWILKKPQYMKAVACNLVTAVVLSSPYLLMSMQAGKRRGMHIDVEGFLQFPNPVLQQIVLSFIPMPLFEKIFGQTRWYEEFIRQGSFCGNGYWYYYCGFLMLALFGYAFMLFMGAFHIEFQDLKQKKWSAKDAIAVMTASFLFVCLTKDTLLAAVSTILAMILCFYYTTKRNGEQETKRVDTRMENGNVREKIFLAIFGTAVFFIVLGFGAKAILANIFSVMPVIKEFRYLFKTMFIIIPLLVPIGCYVLEKIIRVHKAFGIGFAVCFAVIGIYNNYYIAASGTHGYYQNYESQWPELSQSAKEIQTICAAKEIDQKNYRFCTFADPISESDGGWSCYGDTFPAGRKLTRNMPTLAHCFTLGGYSDSWMNVGNEQCQNIFRSKDYEYCWINAVAAREFFQDCRKDSQLETAFIDDVLKNHVKYFLFNEDSIYIDAFIKLIRGDERVAIETDTAFTEGMRLISIAGVGRIVDQEHIWITDVPSMNHLVLQAETWKANEPVTLSFTYQENIIAYYLQQDEKVPLNVAADADGYVELTPHETLKGQQVHIMYRSVFYSCTVMYVLVSSVILFLGAIWIVCVRKNNM